MEATAGATKTAERREIVVASPVTGVEVGRVAVSTPLDVRAAVDAARAAQVEWGALRVAERCRRLKKYRAALADRLPEVLELLQKEAGKSVPDAFIEASGIFPAATYFLARGPKVLKDRGIDLLATLVLRAKVRYAPRGVVAIIAPWNYPFLIPTYESFCAWVAGNAVVVKPSEWTPLVLDKAKAIWDEAGMPADLFRVVHGYGDVGSALIDALPDKVHFTGSTRTGKKVAAACGERLIPCTLELGGKAPAIVLEDADLERTARAIVWGRFFNSGQTCIAVERIYAVGSIAEPLTRRLVELSKEIKQGSPEDPATDLGAMVFPAQLDHVERLVQKAREKGATVETGGERAKGPGRFFPPTILTGVRQDMEIVKEEAFGPVLPIVRVATEDEAVRLANDSSLGLNAYVFAGSNGRGRRVAERVRAGTVMVNDVVVNFGFAAIPFGGVKESGIGRSHGAEGLRANCEERVIVSPLLASLPVSKLVRYPYSREKTMKIERWVRRLFGSGKK
jgi:succinate-semialdehyde dehydrogenase/glutarate-semialdehyde dehydrogenase